MRDKEPEKFARIIEAPNYGDNMLVIHGVTDGCGQFEDQKDAEKVAQAINTAADAFALKKVLRALEMAKNIAGEAVEFGKKNNNNGRICASLEILKEIKSLASKIEKGDVTL